MNSARRERILEKHASFLSQLLMGREAPSLTRGAVTGGLLGGAVGLPTGSGIAKKKAADLIKGIAERATAKHGIGMDHPGFAKKVKDMNEEAFKRFAPSLVRKGMGGGALLGSGAGVSIQALRKARYAKEYKKRKLLAALGLTGAGVGAIGLRKATEY